MLYGENGWRESAACVYVCVVCVCAGLVKHMYFVCVCVYQYVLGVQPAHRVVVRMPYDLFNRLVK